MCIQVNGSIPAILIFLIPERTPFMALNGIEITLFIPLIIAFTTLLKAFTIPSFIPSKIFPPALNTFFTADHACVNLSLNHPVIFPNTDVIAFHAPDTPSFTFVMMLFHALDIPSTILFQISETLSFTVLNAVDIASFIPLKIALAVSFIPFHKFERNSQMPFHRFITILHIPCHRLDKNSPIALNISIAFCFIHSHPAAKAAEISSQYTTTATIIAISAVIANITSVTGEVTSPITATAIPVTTLNISIAPQSIPIAAAILPIIIAHPSIFSLFSSIKNPTNSFNFSVTNSIAPVNFSNAPTPTSNIH